MALTHSQNKGGAIFVDFISQGIVYPLKYVFEKMNKILKVKNKPF